MNTNQVRDAIREITDNCIGIKVFFVDSGNNVYDSDIENDALDEYRKSFANGLKKKYIENDYFSSPLLSAADERKHALYQFDFDEKPFEFKLLDKVDNLKANENLDTYLVKAHGLSTLRAIIVRLKNQNGQSMSFYQYVHSNSIWKSEKKFHITTHETRVVKLTDDVLRLSDNFIMAKLQDNYFIENVNALEKELCFDEIIRNKATVNLGSLRGLDLVENLDKFSQRIQADTSFARKFVKVYKHSPVIEKNLSNKEIIDFAMSKPFYKDKLKLNKQGDRFDLESIGRCGHFLTLLDDDFVKSELTGQEYISRAKDRATAA